MRRVIGISIALVAVVAIFVAGSAAGGDEGNYEVRAVFDNAGFLVDGEEVRVAGAKVGVVTEVTVSNDEEPALEDGSPDPGKAVVVMQIEDPAFQDFRADASCLIRPQSLIGEKFVECEPTQPRAASTPLPPPLEQIEDGPGDGQYLLPLERNGKAVDLDLVNNIMEEPYPDRFRLILNDLGAGLAARGDELGEIIERSNPALRETNEVLAVLAGQNRVLAKLSADSDQVITALANRRENIADFINASQTTAQASAERGAELQAGLQRFPGFLRELRLTMTELDRFSTTATPVFTNLGEAAPALTRVNRALIPFSSAGTTALRTLGDAAEEAGPDIVSADPVIRQVRSLARSGAPSTKELKRLLASLRKTEGFRYLAEFFFNSSGVVNGFDQYGHFTRALLPLNNCVDYESIPEPGCDAKWVPSGLVVREEGKSRKRKATLKAAEAVAKALADPSASAEPYEPDSEQPADPEAEGGAGEDAPPADVTPEPLPPTETPEDEAAPPNSLSPNPQSGTSAPGTTAQRMRATRRLLDFLIGDAGPAQKTRADKRGER